MLAQDILIDLFALVENPLIIVILIPEKEQEFKI